MGCHASIPIDRDQFIYKEPCLHDQFLEEVVVLSNGSKRNISQWIPKSKDVKAIVLIAHGLHEHALIFDKLAHEFTQRDFACFGIDHVGHGKSDGKRGLIKDHRILVSDFVSFASHVRSKPNFAKLPMFIFCHSLGTLITIMALSQLRDVVSVVFTGAAIYPGYASASPYGIKMLYPLSNTSVGRGFALVTSSVGPTGAAAPILLKEVTSDPENYDKRLHDDRSYFGPVMNKTAYEVLKLIKASKNELRNMRTPFLAIHGKDDQMTLPKGSQYLHDHSGTDKRKKSLVIIDHCKHNPLLESHDISNDFIQQVANYFDSFLMAKLQLKDVSITV